MLQYHPLEARTPPAPGAGPRIGGAGGLCTYRALDHALISSDHTAVSCGFQLALPCRVDWEMLRLANMPPSASAVAAPASASGASSAAAPVTEPAGSTAAGAGAGPGASVTPDDNALLVVPAPRSSSSSVSSPNAHAVASPPAILVVRLLSVKVLCASPSAGAAGVPPPCAAEHSPAVHSRTLSGGVGMWAGTGAGAGGAGGAGAGAGAGVGFDFSSPHLQPPSRPLLPPEVVEHSPEPKYVRILFPAPFENGGIVPSRQVSFATSGTMSVGSSPRIVGAHPPPQMHPVHSASSSAAPSPRLPPTAASASSTAASAGDALPGGPPPPLSHSLTPPPVEGVAAADSMEGAIPLPFGALTTKAEFRCLAFDDAPLFAQLAGATASAHAHAAAPASSFSAAAAGSATAAYASAAAGAAGASPSASARSSAPPSYVPPPAAPYHLLLKMHASDGLSGQCGVALPRAHFNSGDTLEFLEGLSRDGLPLLHPVTRAPVRVHFVLALSVAPAPAQLTQAHAARSALQLLKNGKIN